MAEMDPNNAGEPDEDAGAEPSQPATLDYAPSTPAHLRLIAQFPSDFEANLASNLLAQHGLSPEPASNHDPWGRQSSALMVPENEMNAAAQILAASPARKHLAVDPSTLPPAPVLPPLTCPNCGSTDLAPIKRWRLIFLPLILLAWLPFVHPFAAILYVCVLLIWPALCLLDRPWVCSKCGKRLPAGGGTPGDKRDGDSRAPGHERFAGTKTAVPLQAPKLRAKVIALAVWHKRDGEVVERSEPVCELDADGRACR